MVTHGQVWENGKSAVKIQKAEDDRLLAVTFNIGRKGRLSFSHAATLDESSALAYVESLGCKLTDKVLTTSMN
jgi:hypothetical protein